MLIKHIYFLFIKKTKQKKAQDSEGFEMVPSESHSEREYENFKQTEVKLDSENISFRNLSN